MPESIPAIRIAATTGIVASAWISGSIAGLSLMAVPGMAAGLVPAQELARQWEAMFNIGKNLGPGMALFTLLPYSYAAYQRSAGNRDWRSYAVACGLTLAIVPYTLILMRPTNNQLLAAAAGATRSLGDEAVKDLLGKWKLLNLARSFLPLFGSLIGLSALLA
ncbi:uncharacterized protein E0L32_003265 [Thyridium curvatum]|uniref:Noranthrone monooxygenase n=1 Tax=Thyridium curvatum TaxID=1093900 RepID=A0A507BB70_9PEZI|nr:uncharacterized protein E0L32_003265 [Thyridium curvatum]TPX17147.1 hypothetical protein E0L32_003265 [Thyridium curvatum]